MAAFAFGVVIGAALSCLIHNSQSALRGPDPAPVARGPMKDAVTSIRAIGERLGRVEGSLAGVIDRLDRLASRDSASAKVATGLIDEGASAREAASARSDREAKRVTRFHVGIESPSIAARVAELTRLPVAERWLRAQREVGLTDPEVERLRADVEAHQAAVALVRAEAPGTDGYPRLAELGTSFRARVEAYLSAEKLKQWDELGFQDLFGLALPRRVEEAEEILSK